MVELNELYLMLQEKPNVPKINVQNHIFPKSMKGFALGQTMSILKTC